ncbi:hypothetical protein PLICRDRAFT_181174 [Plicaturopsis crispa FD-325 SS-3]|uniref:Uncharacterized protein n=1 Tax=Plicaturopsis crispa FD-325 SS-3 TaxID=944288 RepID=A0A0C9SPI9_PLICR|nr:hypothetical protein PLICRDRAFT_181174 [Plicaturopsis crispa FD-325 SS-3]
MGPHQMRYEGGFIDWRGNYYVPGDASVRSRSVERLQRQGQGGGSGPHRSASRHSEVGLGGVRNSRSYAQAGGPSRQGAAGPSRQVTASSSRQATAGPSRQVAAGSSRQAIAGPSRQATAGPSRQAAAGPSRQAAAGPSRQTGGASRPSGRRLPPIDEFSERARYRQRVPVEDDVDDDMNLGADNIPRMMGYPEYDDEYIAYSSS